MTDMHKSTRQNGIIDNTGLQANILVQVENLKGLAEKPMTTEVALQGQMIADVISNAFEQIHEDGAVDEQVMLTEQELWGRFTKSSVQMNTPFGKTAARVDVARHLHDLDEFDCLGLCEALTEILEADEYPESTLNSFIGEISNYLENLQVISDTFAAEKRRLVIIPEVDSGAEQDHYGIPNWENA